MSVSRIRRVGDMSWVRLYFRVIKIWPELGAAIVTVPACLGWQSVESSIHQLPPHLGNPSFWFYFNHSAFKMTETNNSTESEQQYKFNVSMSCSGCSGAVERALKKQEGVAKIDISLETQTVLVHAKAPATFEIVREKIANTGKTINSSEILASWRCFQLPSHPRPPKLRASNFQDDNLIVPLQDCREWPSSFYSWTQ